MSAEFEPPEFAVRQKGAELHSECGPKHSMNETRALHLILNLNRAKVLRLVAHSGEL